MKAIVIEKCTQKKINIIAEKESQKEIYKSLLNIETENRNDFKFIFDDHGSNYIILNKDLYCQIMTYKEKLFYQDYIQPKKEKLNSPFVVYKVFDSIVNNVVVLDERIQEKAEEKYALERNDERPNISYREVWQNVGCFIPWKDEVDLSSSDFSGSCEKDKKNESGETKISTTDKIKNWVASLKDGKLKIQKDNNGNFKTITDRTYKNIDTLIIHLGVIEKCLTADGKEKNSAEDKENFIKDILGDLTMKYVNVILTSGRAPKEENLFKGCSFVTISVLTDYLIKNRFKYSLNELCNLARPLKN